MTGFSFEQPNADDQPPTEPAPGEVTLGTFWPPVNIAAIRRDARITDNVTSDRLRTATQNAVLNVARQLKPWRTQLEAAGFDSLKDVPSEEIDGMTEYEVLWARAVTSEVAADLAERPGVGATPAGADRAEQLQSDVDVHRRNVIQAIRDFLGTSRIVAEAL